MLINFVLGMFFTLKSFLLSGAPRMPSYFSHSHRPFTKPKFPVPVNSLFLFAAKAYVVFMENTLSVCRPTNTYCILFPQDPTTLPTFKPVYIYGTDPSMNIKVSAV